MHNERELSQYDKWNVPRPSQDQHGVTPDDIREKLVSVKPNKWHMEGNLLIADTDWGPLVQNIPTDYIMTGVDDKGLPILTKVKLKK